MVRNLSRVTYSLRASEHRDNAAAMSLCQVLKVVEVMNFQFVRGKITRTWKMEVRRLNRNCIAVLDLPFCMVRVGDCLDIIVCFRSVSNVRRHDTCGCPK